MEPLESAAELVWPEPLVTMTAEDYERRALCAEHGRSLSQRLELAAWQAYCRRHAGEPAPAKATRRSGRGFG